MKKLALSLAAVAALAFAPSAAQAQATDEGTIAVSATIQSILRFGASTALDFGTVVPGQAATGQGSIELIRNVGAVLTFPNDTEVGVLTGPGGTISPEYTCGVGATATAIDTNFDGDCATGSLTLDAPAGLSTQYVVFNGALTAAQTNTTPGAYTGTIRVLATQN
jgi:spore coat protein U-like protein